jgi:ligand-binding sensor domain-containing protein
VNTLRTREFIAALCALAIVSAFAAGIIVWRANRAVTIATREATEAGRIPFSVTRVNAVTPAGMEAIATPAGFRDIVLYHERVYLSGPSGLAAYDADGNLIHKYRVGLDLPPVELGAMSAGIVPGAPQTELFIATHGAGVLAFDGQQFRQIKPSDAALSNTTAVLALNTGRVLIATERGLLVYDGRNVTPFDPQLKTAYITALAGTEGDLWIGTLANGLFHYHAGQLDALGGALPDPQVLSLAASGDRVYAGTPLGVVEFVAGRRTRTLADGFFAAALAADARCLMVGTEDEGIVGVPLQARGCAADLHVAGGPVRRIAVLNDAAHFALTDRAVYRLDASSGEWRQAMVADASALVNRNIAALAIGRDGRLWVGYFDAGLDIIETNFEHVKHFEDDHLLSINRIVPEPAGDRTAVASANGLILFDSASTVRQILGRKDGLLSDHVTDVVFRSGGMTVATTAGLSFVDANGVRSLYAFHGLVNNHVYALASAGGRTLAGTLGGISSVENDTVRVNYDTSNSGLKHNWITAVVAAGGEWFAGTYGAGVFRLDENGRWHAYPDLEDGFIVNPNAMVATESRVYAGSLGRGLFVLDRASSRWTAITNGLPSLNVTALAERGGVLYAGTDNGLVRIQEGAAR